MKISTVDFIDKQSIPVSWGNSHLYIPTPLELSDRVRVFVSIWDELSIGRVGYVDLDKTNFSIINYSRQPCLDIGQPGRFDERGVTPMSLICQNGVLYLFYTGWGNKEGFPYTLLTGLAYSVDEGHTFYRVSKDPVLNPQNDHSIIKTAAYVKRVDNKYKMWYVGGENWTIIDGKHTPTYNLRTIESDTLYRWTGSQTQVLKAAPDRREFALGRPWVEYKDNLYHLFISARTRHKGYHLSYAISADGNQWTRKDDKVEIDEHKHNSTMKCFSSLLKIKDKTYMFYNGNQYGKDGFFISECIY